MKVVVAEPDKQVAKNIQRILQTIDDSIEVTGIATDMDELSGRIQQTEMPDLVLINRNLIRQPQHSVEARLVIPAGKHPLVYHAFRAHHIPLLQKSQDCKKPIPAPAALLPGKSMERGYKKRFLVTHQQKFISVPVEDISNFFSDNRFIFFITFSNKKYLVEYRMDELEAMLDPQQFFRINRSYIISIQAVTMAHPYPGNRFKLTLHPPTSKDIIVSRERLPAFKGWLGA